jgi:hypothetical protein
MPPSAFFLDAEGAGMKHLLLMNAALPATQQPPALPASNCNDQTTPSRQQYDISSATPIQDAVQLQAHGVIGKTGMKTHLNHSSQCKFPLRTNSCSKLLEDGRSDNLSFRSLESGELPVAVLDYPHDQLATNLKSGEVLLPRNSDSLNRKEDMHKSYFKATDDRQACYSAGSRRPAVTRRPSPLGNARMTTDVKEVR